MSNINTAIRYVPDARPNERLSDLTAAYAQQDNAAVLAEAVRRLKTLATEQGTPRLFDTAGIGCIGLIGEYGPVGYGIRRAQEVIRVDRTPSYWSHAFVIATALSESAEQNRDLTQAAWIWESSLDPTGSFTNFAGRYGAGARRIAEYNNPTFDFFSPHSVPNIAVIAIGLTERERADLMQRADHPDVDQLHYDLPALLGSWFGYLSNRADRRNPLSEGQAEYSAAYVQLGYEAAGLDLAPGSHQRNIAPEHIWQTAKYLYQRLPTITEPSEPRTTGSAPSVPRRDPVPRPVAGWYCVREKAGVLVPPDFTGPRSLSEAVSQATVPPQEGRLGRPASGRTRRRGAGGG